VDGGVASVRAAISGAMRQRVGADNLAGCAGFPGCHIRAPALQRLPRQRWGAHHEEARGCQVPLHPAPFIARERARNRVAAMRIPAQPRRISKAHSTGVASPCGNGRGQKKLTLIAQGETTVT
jgi:hypothetical protein